MQANFLACACVLGSFLAAWLLLCECLYVCVHIGVSVCMQTHSMSAVELLQQGVVSAFWKAALLVDEGQHAEFLKQGEEGKTEASLP